MRGKLKNIIVLGLIFTFASAAIFCCCIPDAAQASEVVPECHQTSHQTHDSQNHNSEDCDCPNIISITIEKTNTHFELAKIAYGLIPTSYQEYTSFTPTIIAYQAPPIIYDTSPLYIKYSILRI